MVCYLPDPVKTAILDFPIAITQLLNELLIDDIASILLQFLGKLRSWCLKVGVNVHIVALGSSGSASDLPEEAIAILDLSHSLRIAAPNRFLV